MASLTLVEIAVSVLQRHQRPLSARDIAEKAGQLGLMDQGSGNSGQKIGAALMGSIYRAQIYGLTQVVSKPARGIYGLTAWESRALAGGVAPAARTVVRGRQGAKLTLVQVAEEVLRRRRRPLTAREIVDTAVLLAVQRISRSMITGTRVV